MRQYKIFVLVLQVIVSQSIFCGFDRIAQPTAVFGKGFSGAAVYLHDGSGINPAASGNLQNSFVSIFYSPSPFQLSQLSNSGISAGKNFNFGNIAFSAATFGFSLYRENSAMLNYSLKLKNEFSIGASINVNNVSIASYGSASTVGIDAGVIFSPIENIFLGFSALNINRPNLSSYNDEIPLLYNAGIAYRIEEIATLNIDLQSEFRSNAEWKFGIEFTPLQFVTLRAGYNESIHRLFGGIGIEYGGIQFNYGAALHNELGTTHSIGITIFP